MASFQVTCHAPDDMDVERRVRGLGGQGWWFPAESVIQMIENRQHEFWASIGGQRHEITIARHGVGGRKYLTTAEGGFPPKALLSLPVCQLPDQEAAGASSGRWASVR